MVWVVRDDSYDLAEISGKSLHPAQERVGLLRIAEKKEPAIFSFRLAPPLTAAIPHHADDPPSTDLQKRRSM